MPVGRQITFNAGELEEAFIDGIDFLPRTELSEYCYGAVAHVGILFIVGREPTTSISQSAHEIFAEQVHFSYSY